jgi:hypothetical protein
VWYDPTAVKRLPRILSITATAASLVLLVTTLAFWLRSQRYTDQWRSYRLQADANPLRAREIALATYRNAIAFKLSDDEFPTGDAAWDPNDLPRSMPWSHKVSPRGSAPSPLDTPPGRLGFVWDRVVMNPPSPPGEPVESGLIGQQRLYVIKIKGRTYTMTQQYTALALPWWLLSLLFALRPALLLRRRLARRHHRPGHCPTCGYDLRATPTRCPECGTSPPERRVV